MTQTKKRKAIETVIKSVLLSVMFSKFEKKVFNTLIQKIVLVHGSIFLCPIWHSNVKFMQHFFFQIVEIPQGHALE